jgi:uncharacterized membrane protein YdjX (TVP38/TMEM64 family)
MNKGKLAVGFMALLLVGAGIALRQQGFFTADALLSLLKAYPVAAPLIFITIYTIVPAVFLPAIPLSLAAGFLWGPVWGVVFAIIGATAGASLSFFLARYLIGDMVRRWVAASRWQWLEESVARHGWRAVAFVRLIPVFPFNIVNYLFGLTPIPFGQYLWSTFVFMLPACIAFVAFGSSLGSLVVEGNIRGLLVGIAVAVLALLLVMVLKPRFRKIGADAQDKRNAEDQKKVSVK